MRMCAQLFLRAIIATGDMAAVNTLRQTVEHEAVRHGPARVCVSVAVP